jgi:quercetin dioxygenase-like cupin family protein
MTLSASRLTPISRDPDDGEAIWAAGGLYTYKALFTETGAYFACEAKGPAGYAIPVHFHDAEEEGFYVAQGEATIFLGDEARRLGAGSFAFVPRGIRHAFRLETADARLLLLVSPGPEHEALFRDLGAPAPERVAPPPPAGPPDMALLGEIAARHGTRIVGPPPAGATEQR